MSLQIAKRSALLLAFLLGLVSVPAVWTSCLGPQGNRAGQLEPLTFGAIPSGSAGLIYAAQEQGFFAANGLSVNVKDYATGVATTDALLKGEVDIAWTAEFPFVRKAFAGAGISIVAVLSRFNDQYLFGRKDHGVEAIPDLKGKTIGVPRNTIAEFYLARFLELNGLHTEDVSVVDVQPSQATDAIADGSLDGAVTWEPYTGQMKARMADKVVAWAVQSNQPGYGLIVARNDWIAAHPERLNRFLKSLVRSEDYLVRNPEAFKDTLQERMGYDDALIGAFWSENRFSISLDQSLIVAMEDEARWMIANNLTSNKTMPDLARFIYVDGLKALKPRSVNIIR